ncbi:DUF1570 domain-containing protein [Coraliomargarita parva]|uniref:DUF1570 domain-containing protein n=1 Tax=Coraliomargarita parva TaxID=3014050 RepID=UPI0022B2DCCF|nr:DUF1570 domain-containing protein [Coraliomargarita parva]
MSRIIAVIFLLSCLNLLSADEHKDHTGSRLSDRRQAVRIHAIAPAHLYLTEHFQFTSDVPLPNALAQHYAQTFEGTYKTLSELLPGISETKKSYRTDFYSDKKQFLEAGGIEGTAGLFLPSQNRIIINLPSGSRRNIESGHINGLLENPVLIHELTHQLLHAELGKLPPWLVEGLAVYMESIPFQNGRFQMDRIDFKTSQPLRKQTENFVHSVRLKTLLTMEAPQWNQDFDYNPHGVNRNYLTAYLLTYFLIHLDRSNSGNSLADFLGTLSQNRTLTHRLDLILRGRSPAELERAMIQAYQLAGFQIDPLGGFNLNTGKAI